MTYSEKIFNLYHRGMLGMWVLFLVVVGGLTMWTHNTERIPVPLPLDGWAELRFIPVMMGAVTLASCLQFLGLGSSMLYFNIRSIVIVGVCFLAYTTTGTLVEGIWKGLPYVILIAEMILLLTFAERIDQEKLIARMLSRLPGINSSKSKVLMWPAMKLGSYCLWLMFNALFGIILYLFHEGWPAEVDGVLYSREGAIMWWSLTMIGVISFWHWILIGIRIVVSDFPGIIRSILYVLLVALLLPMLYWLGFGLDALLIIAPLSLTSLIFSGEIESMRSWNRSRYSE